MRPLLWFVGVSMLLVTPYAGAQGINTHVALPVSQGEAIWRPQVRFKIATDDPTAQRREARVLQLPQTLVYGITSRLTAFATLPLILRKRTEKTGTSQRTKPALGNLTLLGRYMLYRDDFAPLSTRRMAVLFGIKLPSGAERAGTASWDPVIGGVTTWAAGRQELDVDALFRTSFQRQGHRAGKQLRYDAAYRYRLWPKRFGKRLLQLNGVLEINGSWSTRDRDRGQTVHDSGGNRIFLSPGIQLASIRWILEASVQIPILQDLRGRPLATDIISVLGLRIPFSPR